LGVSPNRRKFCILYNGQYPSGVKFNQVCFEKEIAMRKRLSSIFLTASFVSITSFAHAEIINGGFETGNLDSWTSTGQTSVTNAGLDIRTNSNLNMVGTGNHSAMVGNAVAFGFSGDQYSSLSQQWAKGDTFDHLYFAWAAVGLVPTNDFPHTIAQTPWFQINVKNVTDTTTLFSQEFYTGKIGSITPGWLQGATYTGYNNDPGIWYYRPWETFDLDLAGIQTGDLLEITLTTRDCTPTGHSSYAYLDGFGSVPPDINPVPEPSTMLLLAGGIAGLAIWRRKNTV
jgi:hypothetical protein